MRAPRGHARPRLERLTITGFKTIRELRDFEPGSVTVLIGPNGAGKSNFVSFFRLLAWALTPPGQLQLHVAQQGGASAILHRGPAVTPQMTASLSLMASGGVNEYAFRLFHAAGDTLVFADESFRFRRSGDRRPAPVLPPGHREALLIDAAEGGDRTARAIHAMLRRVIVHQFHNTSFTARIRGKWGAQDGRHLKEDAANLGSFLYRLEQEAPAYARRISDTIRLLLPFFGGFELEPDSGGMILLRWREIGTDQVFTAAQASDGMLRIMALVALLQQPETDLPDVLILDEPELGLHPYAIEVIAGLIHAAATTVQVILATQSVALLDRFAPADVVVVDRHGSESHFRRLDVSELADWLSEYTLSELWEKNVLGGRPAP